MPPRLADLTAELQTRHRSADLMRALSASAFARQIGGGPAEYFVKAWPTALNRDTIVKAFDVQTKAAIAPGTTTDPSWAAPLMPSELVGSFVPLIAARSALLQLALQRVPFDVKVAKQLTDASYSWTPESGVKPISKFTFDQSLKVGHTKASGIVILTKELAQLSQPGSVDAMQTALSRGLAYWLDQQFFDPAKAPVAGTNPGSITNGLTPVVVTGTLPAKIAQLIAAFAAALPQASAPTLILSPATKATIPVQDLPDLPIVTTPAVGGNGVIIDCDRVLIAKDDTPQLSTSDEAAVQMDSAPDSPPTAATTMVSLWQLNYIGVRAEMFVSWLPLPNAVAYAVLT